MGSKTDIETLSKADWEGLERDVVMRIRLLKATCETLESNPLNDKIAEDVLLPLLRLLGEFCTRMDVREELSVEQLSGVACVVCGRADRPMLPIMVETEWSTMLFRCAECECSVEEARALVEGQGVRKEGAPE